MGIYSFRVYWTAVQRVPKKELDCGPEYSKKCGTLASDFTHVIRYIILVTNYDVVCISWSKSVIISKRTIVETNRRYAFFNKRHERSCNG